MNISNVNICTEYCVKGNKLIAKNVELIIGTREFKSKKPQKFLLQVLPNKNRTYISSLFPIDNSKQFFKFDYKGCNYFLAIYLNTAKIEKST